jgi:hypothetical protein
VLRTLLLKTTVVSVFITYLQIKNATCTSEVRITMDGTRSL